MPGRGRSGREGETPSAPAAAAHGDASLSGTVVVPFPGEVVGAHGSRRTAVVLPSGRSVAWALLLLVAAAGAYLVARETSIFAIRTVAISGAPPQVAAQVRMALREDVGTNLLKVDLNRARSAVNALPTVASVSFNRAFPHTLVVVVVPERPVAVIRQGGNSWLVSARGRVISRLVHGARPALPRIWTARGVTFAVGSPVADTLLPALAAVSPLGAIRFPARVAAVRTDGGELVLELRSGIEVRLGDARDIPLKLAVAANVLPLVDSSTRYVDVSVPERPVSGTIVAPPTAPSQPQPPANTTQHATSPSLKSQPEGQVITSTRP